MKTSQDKVSAIVSRVALWVALAVAVALPAVYWVIAYTDFSRQLEFKARVKATAVSGLVAASPKLWMYAENRLQGLLAREPVPLETEAVEVYDQLGALLAQAGARPAAPVLQRSFLLHDGPRIAGRVEVSDSLREALFGTALAALLGAILGAAVYAALRIFPLRALRRVTDALFDQKQRAQTTLQSIGDGVITTDAAECVEFMNPVAEHLSGWTLAEARGRPIVDILRVVDATSGQPVATPLRQALAENRIVAFGHEVDLLRRDGSVLGIDDSAAPIRDHEARVCGGVLVFRDVSALRSLTRQRSWEAAHDVLTGLVNRRQFEHQVELAVASARNAGKTHVVCYMDLDQFKVVNDTCGHAAGDDLLKEIAVLLQSRIRESDTLARLGGDEFGLLLEGCSLERAQILASDLLAALDDFRFIHDGKVFTVGVSIGLAIVSGESTGTEIVGMADTACYWAKEQGRGRVCVYRTGDSAMAARRREMGWIARINLALAEDRFTLYHQGYRPLNAAAGDSPHLEVLLRMIDEEGQLVQPGSFLPAAERYHLMPAIDRWVIGRVFSGYRALRAARGGGPLTCAINLSGSSLNAEGFLEFVRLQSRLHALPARAICFEITETAAINNLRSAADFIRECKALGFLFALDDFGTGTSSFGYLKNLPVDYLKIDGGFVRNLEHDAIDKAMTETINRIGHIMGIKTVAEYAENDSIIEELRAMGVDYAQGYGVCVPTTLFEPVPAPSTTPAEGPERQRMALE
jgi:diguanylate cyclase (GGDEF)-like protein/PAS domain S-box-containing protein